MADTSLVMVGLSFLPFAFFHFALSLPANIQAFRVVLNGVGFLTLLLFFNQMAVEVPTMADPLYGLYWAGVVMFVLYLVFEFFQLFAYIMQNMMAQKPR